MITLAEAQASRALRIAGVCPTSQAFINLLNDGCRLLMKRGSWTGTIQFADVCIYNNRVVWNRYVGTVLGLHANCRSTIPMNQWFDWVYPGDTEGRDRFLAWHRGGCGSVFTADLGTTPVFAQIPPCTPHLIQVFITVAADIGKTITLFGIDENTQQIITQRSDGSYQPGEVIRLGIPYSQSTRLYRRIDRVLKDPTQGRLNVMKIDTVTGIMSPLSIYDPSETNPEYLQSRVPNFRAGSGCPSTISAMVKVRFVEAQQPDDLVQVDNLDALAIAMQSVKHSDAYDHAGAEVAMQRAVRDLNYQLRDKFPLEQTTVSFRPFGTAALQKLYLGMR